MVANALGRTRDADISDLSALGFAVRVDNAGDVRVEFQTQEKSKSDAELVSERYAPKVIKNAVYLADSSFTVALSSEDDDLILSIRDALRTPERSLYLGRSSMPIGFVEAEIVNSDTAAQSLRDGLKRQIHTTAKSGGGFSYLIRDIPLSFGSGKRHYLNREVLVIDS